MNEYKVDLNTLDAYYREWQRQGVVPEDISCAIGDFCRAGDQRLSSLEYHPSIGSLYLWYMLMSEEDRLHQARKEGHLIVGAMKDLGTIPVLMGAFERVTTFYPDGAWWLPCFKQRNDQLLEIASDLGIGDGMCPVRSLLGAFETKNHFPIPDLLFSSVGAICDDFSAVVQRLHERGHLVHFWEIPHYRAPEADELYYTTPTGVKILRSHIDWVADEFRLIAQAVTEKTGQSLTEDALRNAITQANEVRALIHTLREGVYGAEYPLFPALEMMVMEMFALHFCSDRSMCKKMLQTMVDELQQSQLSSHAPSENPRVPLFWVNPTADLFAMNLLEQCGARLAGADFMFTHALDMIPCDLPPFEALAVTALSDTMTAPLEARAQRILKDVKHYGARGVIVSRIPGASHCAFESNYLREYLEKEGGLPVIELEIDSVCQGAIESLRTRIEALVELI